MAQHLPPGHRQSRPWVIAAGEGYGPGYLNIIGTEGQQVVLAGGISPIAGPGDATHAKCLVGDYWTGVIDVTND